jgi:hypothetical protein
VTPKDLLRKASQVKQPFYFPNTLKLLLSDCSASSLLPHFAAYATRYQGCKSTWTSVALSVGACVHKWNALVLFSAWFCTPSLSKAPSNNLGPFGYFLRNIKERQLSQVLGESFPRRRDMSQYMKVLSSIFPTLSLFFGTEKSVPQPHLRSDSVWVLRSRQTVQAELEFVARVLCSRCPGPVCQVPVLTSAV